MFKLKYCNSLSDCRNGISRICNRHRTCSHLKVTKSNLPDLNGIFTQNCSILRKLSIIDCKIECIAVATFEHLVNLQFLNLTHNNLGMLEENLFAKNSQLLHLNVSGNKLKSLESRFFSHLKSLKELSLAENYLIVFSGVCLPELLKLNLSFNMLNKFDNNFLPNLETLNLSHNKLHTITDNKGCLLHLKTLLLDSNLFVSVNNQLLRNLPSLTQLTIALNRILKIEPEVLQNLRNLTIFKCDMNCSGTSFEIETELFRFNCHLTVISLANSRITKIGENSFANLNNLKILHLNRNSLRKLPAAFLPHGSFRLDDIDLSENPIDSIVGPLRATKTDASATIRLLDLSKTRIVHLDECSFFGVRIEQLSLRGNYGSDRLPIVDFVQFSDLKILDLSDNNFGMNRNRNRSFYQLADPAVANVCAAFSRNSFLNRSLFRPDLSNSLIELYLNNCHIEMISDMFFANLTRLKILNLRNNCLVFLDHCLRPLENLEALILSQNRLIDFETNPFQFNRKLVTLDLRENKLQNLKFSYVHGIRNFQYDIDTVRLIHDS